MNSRSTSQNGYLISLRGTEWRYCLAPEQMQEVVSHWKAWFDCLTAEGKVAGGSPLENTGKVISGKGGRVIADGPFTESKEAVGGYFLLKVKTEAEAVAIARDCPGLPYGAVVEVRPIAEICPVGQDAQALGSRQAVLV